MDVVAQVRRKIAWREQRGRVSPTTMEICVSPAALEELLFDARSKPSLQLGQHGLSFDGYPLRIETRSAAASRVFTRLTF
jgi:hypothetical protein